MSKEKSKIGEKAPKGYIGGMVRLGKDGRPLTPAEVQATALVGDKDPRPSMHIDVSGSK